MWGGGPVVVLPVVLALYCSARYSLLCCAVAIEPSRQSAHESVPLCSCTPLLRDQNRMWSQGCKRRMVLCNMFSTFLQPFWFPEGACKRRQSLICERRKEPLLRGARCVVEHCSMPGWTKPQQSSTETSTQCHKTTRADYEELRILFLNVCEA